MQYIALHYTLYYCILFWNNVQEWSFYQYNLIYYFMLAENQAIPNKFYN